MRTEKDLEIEKRLKKLGFRVGEKIVYKGKSASIVGVDLFGNSLLVKTDEEGKGFFAPEHSYQDLAKNFVHVSFRHDAIIKTKQFNYMWVRHSDSDIKRNDKQTEDRKLSVGDTIVIGGRTLSVINTDEKNIFIKELLPKSSGGFQLGDEVYISHNGINPHPFFINIARHFKGKIVGVQKQDGRVVEYILELDGTQPDSIGSKALTAPLHSTYSYQNDKKYISLPEMSFTKIDPAQKIKEHKDRYSKYAEDICQTHNYKIGEVISAIIDGKKYAGKIVGGTPNNCFLIELLDDVDFTKNNAEVYKHYLHNSIKHSPSKKYYTVSYGNISKVEPENKIEITSDEEINNQLSKYKVKLGQRVSFYISQETGRPTGRPKILANILFSKLQEENKQYFYTGHGTVVGVCKNTGGVIVVPDKETYNGRYRLLKDAGQNAIISKNSVIKDDDNIFFFPEDHLTVEEAPVDPVPLTHKDGNYYTKDGVIKHGHIASIIGSVIKFDNGDQALLSDVFQVNEANTIRVLKDKFKVSLGQKIKFNNNGQTIDGTIVGCFGENLIVANNQVGLSSLYFQDLFISHTDELLLSIRPDQLIKEDKLSFKFGDRVSFNILDKNGYSITVHGRVYNDYYIVVDKPERIDPIKYGLFNATDKKTRERYKQAYGELPDTPCLMSISRSGVQKEKLRGDVQIDDYVDTSFGDKIIRSLVIGYTANFTPILYSPDVSSKCSNIPSDYICSSFSLKNDRVGTFISGDVKKINDMAPSKVLKGEPDKVLANNGSSLEWDGLVGIDGIDDKKVEETKGEREKKEINEANLKKEKLKKIILEASELKDKIKEAKDKDAKVPPIELHIGDRIVYTKDNSDETTNGTVLGTFDDLYLIKVDDKEFASRTGFGAPLNAFKGSVHINFEAVAKKYNIDVNENTCFLVSKRELSHENLLSFKIGDRVKKDSGEKGLIIGYTNSKLPICYFEKVKFSCSILHSDFIDPKYRHLIPEYREKKDLMFAGIEVLSPLKLHDKKILADTDPVIEYTTVHSIDELRKAISEISQQSFPIFKLEYAQSFETVLNELNKLQKEIEGKKKIIDTEISKNDITTKADDKGMALKYNVDSADLSQKEIEALIKRAEEFNERFNYRGTKEKIEDAKQGADEYFDKIRGDAVYSQYDIDKASLILPNDNKNPATINDPPKDNIQEDSQIKEESIFVKAGYRIAGTQITNVSHKFLIHSIQKQNVQKEYLKAAEEIFQSDVGKAITGMSIGLLLPQIPNFKDNNKVQRVSEELRINAMTVLGNSIFETLIEELGQIFQDIEKSIPAEETKEIAAKNIEGEENYAPNYLLN